MRIGLIGLGKAGLRHLAAVRKSGEAEAVAVADPGPAAAKAAGEWGIPLFLDYNQMLQQVHCDAVVISLPHSLLPAAAITAARHGVHILLEKPMALTTDDAEAVVAAAESARVRLMVNFVHRFRAEYRQAHAALNAGAIGRPVMFIDVMASGRGDLPDWTWKREVAGGGMMMYNGVHSLDRLAWLAGSPIVKVSGAQATFAYATELEDNMVGTLTFANGALGAVVQHKSDATATMGGWQTSIFGTRGAIRIQTGVGLEVVSDKERFSQQVTEDDRFLGALREFLGAIRAGRDPSPSGRDGIHALAAVLGLYQAASRDQVIALK